jgi:regulator of replication initiation timing
MEKTYEALQIENKRLRDALEHIEITALRSRSMTRRIRWIAIRARDGLDGTTLSKEVDLPASASITTMENQKKRIDRLEAENKRLRAKISEPRSFTERVKDALSFDRR